MSAQDPALLNDEFFKIHFEHLATQQKVSFKGWVTSFSDSFNSNWNEQTVYGRMDPLATFQGTSRTISMGFDVVAKNLQEAVMNQANISRLIEFLYPVYNGTERSNQNTLKAAPLLGLRYTNLVSNTATGQQLIGWVDGIDYSPDIVQGGFMAGGKSTTGVTSTGGLADAGATAGPDAMSTTLTLDQTTRKAFVPKQVSLQFTFHVVHTHLVGWTPTKIFGNGSVDYSFPNNTALTYTSTDTFTTIVDQNGQITTTAEVGPQTAANETEVLGSTGDS
jgi:hypothetical protein